jgi:hypothetical protein
MSITTVSICNVGARKMGYKGSKGRSLIQYSQLSLQILAIKTTQLQTTTMIPENVETRLFINNEVRIPLSSILES